MYCSLLQGLVLTWCFSAPAQPTAHFQQIQIALQYLFFLGFSGRWFSSSSWVLLVGALLLQGWWCSILQATTVPEGISLYEFQGQKLLLDKLGSALSSLLPLNPCSEQTEGWHLGPWQQTREMKADVTEATKMFCFLTWNGDSILPSLLLSKDKTWLSGVQNLSHCWWFK